jgi:hypothetical protein
MSACPHASRLIPVHTFLWNAILGTSLFLIVDNDISQQYIERIVAYPLQQLLGERARLLRYTYTVYLDRYLLYLSGSEPLLLQH